MTLHIGFTGTRYGMTGMQRFMVMWILEEQIDDTMTAMMDPVVVHHGDCEGSDAEFHDFVLRSLAPVGWKIEIHPGPNGDPHRAHCMSYDRIYAPLPHMQRNRAIVNASSIVIATPLEDVAQKRGGTWATVRMARKAVHQPKLYVVGRSGVLLP